MKHKQLMTAKVLGVFLFALMLCLPSLAKADSISPASFSATLGVGESVTITKTLTVDTAPATKVDVYFMADTTGSMGGAIGGVKAAASSILSSAAALGDVAFAVGEYKDSFDVYPYRLNTAMTTSTATAQAGINMWAASGGYDHPEGQFNALQTAATSGATGWRAGSERIMVWFGDAPGHDPTVGGATEASATAALVAAGIQVEAIDVGGSTYGLNGSAISYNASEGGPVTPGSATRIATATGGNYYTSANSSAIVAVINNAISTAIANYTNVGIDLSEVPLGVTVASVPASYTGAWTRDVARTFTFDVTFTGDTPGTYDFSIYGTVDGGRIGAELDHIVVADASVPEPSTLLLLGSGLVGLAAYRRTKRA